MHTRRIGDAEVSAIGLGGMPMSIEGRPDEARSLATLHAAHRVPALEPPRRHLPGP
ncbi:hypothetical protein [Streptomyces sp. WM6386]|uniref:hypothetical protein n=1 Tax=Streptomyces sp. WM6386 TaxID=1415558 RepID=UPI000A500187